MSLFKRKKKNIEAEVSVTFTETMFTYNDYTPWDTSKKNADNDFANSIFMGMYSYKPRSFPKSPDDYPRYVSYELGIYDPIRKFKDLLSAGFIEVAHERAALSTYKVAELKDILEAHNLSTKGKKDDLIDRIINDVNLDSLSLPSYYTLSEKGFTFIKENDDLIKLHNNPYNISYEEYIETKQSYPFPMKYNDLVWAIFNKREMNFSVCDHGLRRNNALHRAMFLKKENRLVDSLFNYVLVLFYDLNILEWDSIAPEVQSAIYELQEHYIDTIVPKCYEHSFKPINKFQPSEFEEILKAIFDGQEEIIIGK